MASGLSTSAIFFDKASARGVSVLRESHRGILGIHLNGISGESKISYRLSAISLFAGISTKNPDSLIRKHGADEFGFNFCNPLVFCLFGSSSEKIWVE